MVSTQCPRIDPKRFPGEGRGPVANQPGMGAARDCFRTRDWAPAFAGEAGLVKMYMYRPIFGHALKQVRGDGVSVIG